MGGGRGGASSLGRREWQMGPFRRLSCPRLQEAFDCSGPLLPAKHTEVPGSRSRSTLSTQEHMVSISFKPQHTRLQPRHTPALVGAVPKAMVSLHMHVSQLGSLHHCRARCHSPCRRPRSPVSWTLLSLPGQASLDQPHRFSDVFLSQPP